MKKILVIGGTGTMGKPLVNYLLAEGHDVSVICRNKANEIPNVHYLYGNAKDLGFMQLCLNGHHYDAIVDFCYYTSEEFTLRYEALLKSTSQYICLSSCAVIADGDLPLTEESPRFLDVNGRTTGRNIPYHISKALIEDILLHSEYKNWTIVRPHITYNDTHLIWGEFCEEEFILRSVLGKKIIVPKDMMSCKTSLTYGGDVSWMIKKLIGNEDAYGEIFNLVSPQCYTWEQILFMYREILKERGIRMQFVYTEDSSSLREAIPVLKDRYLFDRLLNRVFSIDKFQRLIDEQVKFADLREQLSECIDSYLAGLKKKGLVFRHVFNCAQQDRLTGDWTAYRHFKSRKQWVAYLCYRIPLFTSPYEIAIKTVKVLKRL